MIISHEHKFIFLKTKKTAGTSLEIALSKICGKRDVITPLEYNDDKIRKRIKGRPPQNFTQGMKNHTTAEKLTELISSHIWNGYTKITSVRNTYDMMVSKYYWERQEERDFDEWYSNYKKSATCNWEIYTINNKPAMDFYIRYEHIIEDCSELSKLLGLEYDLGNLISKIRTKHEHRESQWPEIGRESLLKIASDAKQEIEYFNYKIPECYKTILDTEIDNGKIQGRSA